MATGSQLQQTRKLSKRSEKIDRLQGGEEERGEEEEEEEEKGAMMLSLGGHFSRLQASVAFGLFLALVVADRVSGAIFTSAQQYSSSINCESSRLIRCQNDIIRDIQAFSSLNLASVQYPISGPPYSPSKQAQQQQQQLVNPSTCRLMRSNLDCLLATTPACYEQGIQTAQNTDIILRAKRFLEQNGCNGPNSSTWQSTFCYTSPEIKRCEERYDFTGFNSISTSLIAANNITACRAYQAFRYCVDAHLRLSCKVQEIDMANEYLIDRASDLSWRCPANNSATQASLLYNGNPYQLSNQPGAILSPSGYNNFGSSYDQQRPTYVGSQAGSVNLFSGPRDQAWERYRQPDDYAANYAGIGRYPLGSGSLGVSDRLVATNQAGFEIFDNECVLKAQPYARECEDNMRAQQRLASSESRDGSELERRTCCSLFQLRDCISRVVIDRCADATPQAVDMLLGVRRRELTISCRTFSRDVCSGSMAETVLNLPLLLAVAIITSFMTLKQTVLATISL